MSTVLHTSLSNFKARQSFQNSTVAWPAVKNFGLSKGFCEAGTPPKVKISAKGKFNRRFANVEYCQSLTWLVTNRLSKGGQTSVESSMETTATRGVGVSNQVTLSCKKKSSGWVQNLLSSFFKKMA
jgi:hypothetical protein